MVRTCQKLFVLSFAESLTIQSQKKPASERSLKTLLRWLCRLPVPPRRDFAAGRGGRSEAMAVAVDGRANTLVEWNLCHSQYGSCPKMGIPSGKTWLGNPRTKMGMCMGESMGHLLLPCLIGRGHPKIQSLKSLIMIFQIMFRLKIAILRFTPLLDKPVWQNPQDDNIYFLQMVSMFGMFSSEPSDVYPQPN